MVEAWFQIAGEELEPRRVVVLGLDRDKTDRYNETVFTVQSPETQVKSYAFWYELDVISKSPLC